MKECIKEVGKQLARDKSLASSPFMDLLRLVSEFNELSASIPKIDLVESTKRFMNITQELSRADNLTPAQKEAVKTAKAIFELIVSAGACQVKTMSLYRTAFERTDMGKECVRLAEDVFTDAERAKHYILANKW